MQLVSGKRVAVAIAVLLCALALFTTACDHLFSPAPEESVTDDAVLFSTFVQIQIHEWPEDTDPQAVISAAFDRMERTGSIVSVYDEDSDISAVNRARGETVQISEEAFFLLEMAYKIWDMTDGAFDPTIGPVVDLWGFYTDDHRVPTDEEIEDALTRVDAERVQMDAADRTVRLPQDMRLDVEALAKGFAARAAAEHLMESGVTSALITSGQSSLKAVGDGPEGRAWRVGLLHPRTDEEVYAAVDLYDGESVSTSGDYQRYFERDGERYAHILDPDTGRPPRTIKSITVITTDTVLADGLSTAFFVMEPDQVLSRVENMDDVMAAMMTADGEIKYCSQMEARIKLTGN